MRYWGCFIQNVCMDGVGEEVSNETITAAAAAQLDGVFMVGDYRLRMIYRV